jgi:N-acetylglucosamine repressor
MNNIYYKKGTNLQDVQELNRSLVLRLIRRLKISSRVIIAKETGLKQATITNIVNDLIKWGLVKESGIIDGEKGRRSIGLTLTNKNYKVIGVKLTRKYFSIGLFDLFGSISNCKNVTINRKEGAETALKIMVKSINELLNNSSGNKIIGLGLAIPGPFFKAKNKIAVMSDFPGWENVNLQERMESIFDIPIIIEQDANAGVLAEWLSRPHHKLAGTMVYVTVGYGVGAGIIIEGKLFNGSLGTAGEIGHMSINYKGPKCVCGLRGCLELYCSPKAIVKQARKNLKNYPDSLLNKNCNFEAIIDAVNKNDTYALKILEKVVNYLSIGIVNVVNCFNPDVIVIGDEFIRFGPILLNHLKNTIKQFLNTTIFDNLKLELSGLEKDPAFLGAGNLVIDKILHKPSIIKKINLNNRKV